MRENAKVWHLIVGLFGAMMIVLTFVFMMFSSMGLKATPGSKEIVIAVITALGTLGAAGIAKNFSDTKKEQNKPDLSELNYDDLIGEIISNIQEKLNAYRCAYWAYTNGVYTGDDYSMQNCSMVVEKNAEGVREVIGEMQMIPKVQFRRNIMPLRESAFHITYEDEHNDALAHFNAGYGVKTAIYFKAMNRGKWTGVLGVSFNDSRHQIKEADIAWMRIQISRIEALITKMKK